MEHRKLPKRVEDNSPTLRWITKDRYCIVSVGARYSVAVAFVHGEPSYSAWRRYLSHTEVARAVPLGNFATIDEARDVCQRDWDTARVAA